ncbi:protein TolQ, partial [Acetobacter sp. DmW_125123]
MQRQEALLDRAVDAANLGVNAAGDLSVWALFMHASLVVKIVMLGLLICSVMVWAIILD